MCLSRRFQNLIVDSPYAGAKWLRCVDLMGQLFGNTATPPATIGDEPGSAVVQDYTSQTPAADSWYWKDEQAAAVAATIKMERIWLSRPIFRFITDDPNRFALDCYPLSDRKVVIAHHTGRALLCDADKSCVVPMPNLHKQKRQPISLFVPSAYADDHPTVGGCLYVMERVPNVAKFSRVQLSDEFEAFVCGKPTGTSKGPWHCRLLPQPPFVYDPNKWSTYPQIISYAVVGSNICISTKCNGTYYLDTANNTWGVSQWRLPFYGRAEYVPELKLWFGLSAETRHLAAADFSAMDSQLQLVGDWKEFDTPEGWVEHRFPQLVNLGSGRFCIARFFQNMPMDEELLDRIVVFTGVEVMTVLHDGNGSGSGSGSGSGNGKVKLRMEKHKSRCHVSNDTTIDVVF